MSDEQHKERQAAEGLSFRGVRPSVMVGGKLSRSERQRPHDFSNLLVMLGDSGSWFLRRV